MRLHFAAWRKWVLQLVCRLPPGIEGIGVHNAQDNAHVADRASGVAPEAK
ncbi:hypothetical protein [Burkholderia anthina]|nr:hypothetical protein [Burkholderia anthina]